MVIEQTLGKIFDFDTEGLDFILIELSHEEMLKPHQILTLKDGEKIAISLVMGINLEAGDVILADKNRIVYIDLVKEDALVVRPDNNIQWGKVAFNIGNLHHKVYFTEDSILTPYDKNIESLLLKLGVKYERESRKLDGEKANLKMEGNVHEHDHKEQHEHNHRHG